MCSIPVCVKLKQISHKKGPVKDRRIFNSKRFTTGLDKIKWNRFHLTVLQSSINKSNAIFYGKVIKNFQHQSTLLSQSKNSRMYPLEVKNWVGKRNRICEELTASSRPPHTPLPSCKKRRSEWKFHKSQKFYYIYVKRAWKRADKQAVRTVQEWCTEK